MRAALRRRLLQALPALWAAVTLVWALLFVVPGDPAALIAGVKGTPETLERIRSEWGLDRPVHEQYLVYMGRLLSGDLGLSILQQRPVAAILAEGLPRSILLAAAALAVALPAGTLLGVAAARRGGIAGALLSGLSLAGISVPAFCIGYLLILLFAVNARILPVSGYGTAAHVVLPALTLAVYPASLVARVTRAAFTEQMAARHVTAARARGIRPGSIVWRHALRNALSPVVTISGILSATFIGGAIATETVFSWPGLGQILFRAAESRDVLLVEGGVLLLTGIFIGINLIVDLAYGLIDPRTRGSSA